MGDARYPFLLEARIHSGLFLPELVKHCMKLYACDIHLHFENIEHLLKHYYKIRNYELKSQSIEETGNRIIILMQLLH